MSEMEMKGVNCSNTECGNSFKVWVGDTKTEHFCSFSCNNKTLSWKQQHKRRQRRTEYKVVMRETKNEIEREAYRASKQHKANGTENRIAKT